MNRFLLILSTSLLFFTFMNAQEIRIENSYFTSNRFSILATECDTMNEINLYSFNNMFKNESTFPSNPNPTIRKKSPGTAFTLSLIYPGIGQFYNGDVANGFIHLIFHTISTPLGIIFVAHDEPEQDFLKVGFLSIAGINYIWSLIDAPVTANRINKQSAQMQSHLFEYNIHTAVVGIDLGMKNKTMTANMSIQF